MKRTNWANVEKYAKQLKRNIRNMQSSALFFQNFPTDGHMTDIVNETEKLEDGTKIKKGKVAKDIIIKDAKSSTLRRLVKTLDNYYYLITDETAKAKVLLKKVELETELNSREDGLA